MKKLIKQHFQFGCKVCGGKASARSVKAYAKSLEPSGNAEVVRKQGK